MLSSHRGMARCWARTRRYRVVNGLARKALPCGTAPVLLMKRLLIGPELVAVIKVRSSHLIATKCVGSCIPCRLPTHLDQLGEVGLRGQGYLYGSSKDKRARQPSVAEFQE